MQTNTGGGTAPWLQDTSAGVNLAGNLYSLYNSAHLQGAAGDVFKQSDPFAQYRPGYGADLLSLMQDPSSVSKLPGFQFLLDQGVGAIDRSAAAPGGMGFGSTGEKDLLMKQGIGLADQFYQQQIATLTGLSGANIPPANPYQGLMGMGGAATGMGSSIMGTTNSALALINRLFPGTSVGTPGATGTADSLGGAAAAGASTGWGAPPGMSGGGLNNPDPTQMQYGGAPGATPDWASWGAPASPGIPYDSSGGTVPDLTGMFSGPRAAGGVAATSPGGLSTGAMIGTGGALAGIGLDLAQGKPAGYAGAATGIASLASRYPQIFGLSSAAARNVGTGAGAAGDVLGIIQGVRAGGVSGYSQAGIDAAKLGVAGAGASGAISSGTASEIGGALGYAAIPFSVYNFAKNWQSGSTGSDALQGASTGAAIGSVIPGVGTLIGAGVGAAVGALSSAFGPGRMDQENVGWNHYAAAFDKNPASVAGATPAQNFQALAGIFDARGSAIPFYQRFGRMGENQFTLGMTEQINSAIREGKLSKTAPPAQIYKQIVQPWITSMGGSKGWQDTSTAQGASEKGAVGGLLTNMIAQWQAGMLNAGSHLGVSGQTIPGLPSYGG